jgi:hypothetical protein
MVLIINLNETCTFQRKTAFLRGHAAFRLNVPYKRNAIGDHFNDMFLS